MTTANYHFCHQLIKHSVCQRKAVKPLNLHVLSAFHLLDVCSQFQEDGLCFRKSILFSFKSKDLVFAAYPAHSSKRFITKDVEILMRFPENLDSLKAKSVV